MPDAPPTGQLKRQIGLFHAVLLGLGSILGTGVFVSIGIAAGLAGPAVIVAIVLAALLALCNGLSSAQLAAAHPVAGGTYEYGYRFLHPKLGFTAGWMFLLAKSASAATAGLGIVSFILAWLPGLEDWERLILTLSSVAVVFVVVGVVLTGLRRTSTVNAIIVSFTILGLLSFVVGCAYQAFNDEHAPEISLIPNVPIDEVFHPVILATPLMFVAFTGYGRIATLGEEVQHPRATIPKAILITLAVCVILYAAVGLFVGNSTYYATWVNPVNERALFGSQLLQAAGRFRLTRPLVGLIAFAAITAMLGVLLNLILGLSRVALAMGRRRDLPPVFASVNAAGTTPFPAVIGVGVLIALLTLIGDIKTTWSFSAFTVLIYYGITNLAALRLPAEHRLYPRGFAYAGLAGCLFLCWWVQPMVWIVGCGLIAVGLIWHALAPRMFGLPAPPWEKCVCCGYDLRASTSACPECGTPIPEPPAT